MHLKKGRAAAIRFDIKPLTLEGIGGKIEPHTALAGMKSLPVHRSAHSPELAHSVESEGPIRLRLVHMPHRADNCVGFSFRRMPHRQCAERLARSYLNQHP